MAIGKVHTLVGKVLDVNNLHAVDLHAEEVVVVLNNNNMLQGLLKSRGMGTA